MKTKSALYTILIASLFFPIILNGQVENAKSGNTITDIDGNVYHTVAIGTQIWMVENLKTTRYRNGDSIPNVTHGTTWTALNTGAYCWYNNDEASNKVIHGALYNYYSIADSRNIAPTGWHVAAEADWATLTTFLGGESEAGGKLKDSGSKNWKSPNTGATNSSGFTALPGGCRSQYLGEFIKMGNYGLWWSSQASDPSYAWSRSLLYSNISLTRGYSYKQYGFSVRCVRDL